ncbi:hypothetical protein TeGR_g11254 [Tetraparma gracilis]|uniref:C2 domain-containing protein n=1 Tax=Tetraparma gracilis TaxID=2962635 RepID=A0ABQ6MY48_9STRA|nr:hypothetical protein TeGR_g11254 [Tetraparma gracilis]
MMQAHPEPNRPFFHSISSIFKSKKRLTSSGSTEVRVKPYVHTAWMTEAELQEDAAKPSQFVVDMTATDKPLPTSSKLPPMGTLTVELLEMNGVIKSDMLGKSDPYAVFVFEDKAMKTDYISNCLSPIYPRLCRRAAKFSIRQAASTLYVGCFDYDTDTNVLDDDDPLGRVAIKLSSLRPGTEYDVTYPLQHSELTSLKGERG